MENLNLSNAEIKIKMTTLENEYEVVKKEINTLIDKLSQLDKEYQLLEKVLKERTKGRF
jgi:predicted  nucleic acid-binding Zn-ribbon protein